MLLNTIRKKLLLLFMVLFFLFLAIINTVQFKNTTHDTNSSRLLPSPTSFPPALVEVTPTILYSPAVQRANREVVTVSKVVDGDTIEITGGRKLRYIGIDTPETVDPRRPLQCFGKEASNRNKELVLGKQVELEKDVSETDKFGRLLRYVYVGERMINEQLVQEGYAHASSYPPDIMYQERLTAVQAKARVENKGLWASCQGTSVPPKVPQVPGNASTIITPAQGSSGFACDCSKSCSQITSCDEAYYQLSTCGCKTRDSDGDGVPCESLCR